MLDPGAQLPAQASGSRSRTAVPAPSDVSHSPGSRCWKQFRFCGRGAPRQGGRAGGRSRRRGLYDSAGGAGRQGWGAGGRALPPAGPLLPICGRKDPTPPCNSYSPAWTPSALPAPGDPPPGTGQGASVPGPRVPDGPHPGGTRRGREACVQLTWEEGKVSHGTVPEGAARPEPQRRPAHQKAARLVLLLGKMMK